MCYLLRNLNSKNCSLLILFRQRNISTRSAFWNNALRVSRATFLQRGRTTIWNPWTLPCFASSRQGVKGPIVSIAQNLRILYDVDSIANWHPTQKCYNKASFSSSVLIWQQTTHFGQKCRCMKASRPNLHFLCHIHAYLHIFSLTE